MNMKLAALFLFLLAALEPALAQQQATLHGLRGEYYQGRNFDNLKIVRNDRAIDFNWTRKSSSLFNSREFLSPAPGVPAEYFSVRWTGQLLAPETGVYTLDVTTDDGMRIWLGGVMVLDSWKNQPATEYTADVELNAGNYYPIKVEYYQVQFDARATVAWRLPSQPYNAPAQPISSTYFTPAVPQKPKPFAPQPSGSELKVGNTFGQADAPPDFSAEPNSGHGAVKVGLAEIETVSPRPGIVKATTARPSRNVRRIAPVPALKSGTTLTLPNMYFELNTPDLMPASEPTLDALIDALKAQPGVQIQIAGHTDLAKDKAQSVRLSQERADVVRDYLVENGIDSMRITAKGYGCAKPLVNKSDAKNRRVEVVVK